MVIYFVFCLLSAVFLDLIANFEILHIVAIMVFQIISFFDISLTNSTSSSSYLLFLVGTKIFSNKSVKIIFLLFLMFLCLELFIFWFNLFVRPEAIPPINSEPLFPKNLEDEPLSGSLAKRLEPISEIVDSKGDNSQVSVPKIEKKCCLKVVFDKSVEGFNKLPHEVQLIAFLFICMVPQMIDHTLRN